MVLTSSLHIDEKIHCGLFLKRLGVALTSKYDLNGQDGRTNNDCGPSLVLILYNTASSHPTASGALTAAPFDVRGVVFSTKESGDLLDLYGLLEDIVEIRR